MAEWKAVSRMDSPSLWQLQAIGLGGRYGRLTNLTWRWGLIWSWWEDWDRWVTQVPNKSLVLASVCIVHSLPQSHALAWCCAPLYTGGCSNCISAASAASYLLIHTAPDTFRRRLPPGEFLFFFLSYSIRRCWLMFKLHLHIADVKCHASHYNLESTP